MCLVYYIGGISLCTGKKLGEPLSTKKKLWKLQAPKLHFETTIGKELVELGEYQKLVEAKKSLRLGIRRCDHCMRYFHGRNGMRKGTKGRVLPL